MSTEDWVTAVGEFMIGFGSIESIVNDMLRLYCSTAVLDFVLPQPLERRKELLKELFKEQSLPLKAREVLFYNLGEITTLARTRNLIAHNPLQLSLDDIFGQLHTVVAPFPQSIKNIRTNKQIKFDELGALLVRVKSLAAALYQNENVLTRLKWHPTFVDSLGRTIDWEPLLQKTGEPEPTPDFDEEWVPPA